MPILLLLALALSVAVAVALAFWRYPAHAAAAPGPLDPARSAGETIAKHRSLRKLLDARLDPAAATGLALTVALALAIGGGMLLGVLAYLARTNAALIRIDNSVAKWGNSHATATSTRLLNDVTQLGSLYVVVALCIV